MLPSLASLIEFEPAKAAIKQALTPALDTAKMTPGEVTLTTLDGEFVPGVEVMRKPDAFFVSPA